MKLVTDAVRSLCLGLALSTPVGCSEDESAQAQKPSAAPPAVVVAEIGTADVPVVRDFVARTEAVETVEIRARIEALVASVEFEEGTPVAAGQVLYRLDERTFQADLEVAEAKLAEATANLQLAQQQVSVRTATAGVSRSKAQLLKAQQDVARLRPLAEKDAVPRQDLDQALAAQAVAEAELDASEATLINAKIEEEVGILLAKAAKKSAEAAVSLARLDLSYCTITSPIAGLIGRNLVSVGNLVGRGEATTLATVSSIDPIYVTLAISEAEFLVYSRRDKERGEDRESGDDRAAPIELILADDTVFDQIGHVKVVDRAVAEETGTLTLVAEFPNPDGVLRAGQFARARISVETIPDAVLVPQRAVMEQQGAKVVLTVDAQDEVHLKTVHLSERFEGSFVVLDGLDPGDRVILEGQLKARPGQKVKPTTKAASSEPAAEEN